MSNALAETINAVHTRQKSISVDKITMAKAMYEDAGVCDANDMGGLVSRNNDCLFESIGNVPPRREKEMRAIISNCKVVSLAASTQT